MSFASALFSKDFDSLSVGDSFTTPGRTITESDVVSFAALTGDWHPQHTDADWAAESAFGERIAHGMLVLSYAVGLVPLDPERILALRRIRDAVFKQPARFGETVHVEGRVEKLDAIDDSVGLVGCTWKIVNGSQTTLARCGIEVLWRREKVGAAGNGQSRADQTKEADPERNPSGVVPL